MLWPVLALIPLSFLLAWPLTLIVIRLSQRVGALDSAGARGHSKILRNVPNTGGIAVFLAIAVPMLVGLLAITLASDSLIAIVPGLETHVERLHGEDGSLGTVLIGFGLLGGMLLMHIIGLIDDRASLGALPKLGVQIAVAATLAIWCEVRLLELLGPVPSVLITIAWIVVVTNAINFMDNMDGLAGGVSAIVASFLLTATIINGQWFIAAALALLIGALLGFLWFNLPPARVFMGDGGSLVVGFLLAVLTTRTTFFHGDLGGSWYGVFMPLIMLAIPIYDFTTVTLIRLGQGKSPFVGDQQHFSHRLVQRGLSTTSAVVIIWCFTAVTAIGGISLGYLETWQAALVFTQTGLILLTLALLEWAGHRGMGDRSAGRPAATSTQPLQDDVTRGT
ncbi:MAG: MraY family glycosyltransferase [Phycisphaerales bacterium]